MQILEGNLEEARNFFDGNNINITVSNRRMLGEFISNVEEADDSAKNPVTNWIHQIKVLSKIARSEPHAAYAVL